MGAAGGAGGGAATCKQSMAGLRHPVLLLFCGILLLCGAGMMQWRSVMLRDLELSRRQGKHFEQMYRDSEEESKDWQQKYAKVKAQLERVMAPPPSYLVPPFLLPTLLLLPLPIYLFPSFPTVIRLLPSVFLPATLWGGRD